jgi:predicted house-cleaning noncanonical NTP pyrophosphatase (MazG superfamily)
MIKTNKGEVEFSGNVNDVIGEMLCTVGKTLELLIINEDYEVLNKIVLPELKKFSKCKNMERLLKVLEG